MPKVALVTGASRGVGKGIARVLGEAGHIVYITGRSRESKLTVPLEGTIDQTASDVTLAGGQGIAIECDHRDDYQIRQVFERISQEQGRLDLLVNNAWEGYQAKQTTKQSGFKTPFWKMPPEFWDTMHRVGVRSHYVASIYAARQMIEQKSGLIIHITATAGQGYSDNVAYGVSKAAINRMAEDMAHELKPYNIAVIALCPSIVTTEMIMSKRKSKQLLAWMETPVFVGRAVKALFEDLHVVQKTGRVLSTRALSSEYGFSDINGHQPKR